VKGSSPSPGVWGCAPTSSSKQAAGLQEKVWDVRYHCIQQAQEQTEEID